MDLEEQYDKLLRYCYMKLRDRTLAEDVTQEAFIRFFESEKYRDMGKEMAYLFTIARNLCIDQFRGRREELPGEIPEELTILSAAEEREQDIVDRIAVETAMDRLDEADREIVMLRFSGDLKINDIAEMMNLSRFAVRRRLSSALAKLRKEMEE